MKSIKQLPKSSRPQEKLLKYGPEKLSNSELLAVIIRIGTKQKNAVQLSHLILKKYNQVLPLVDTNELKSIKGLGEAKSCQIVASFELSKRLLKGKKIKLILTAKDLDNELRDIKNSKKEHFVVFYLNAASQQIVKETISIGTIDTTIIHPREVYEGAVKNLASYIMVAHNHPSGQCEPTDEDISITKQLKRAGSILGIKLLEHVIVTKNSFFSFRENKLL